MSYGFNSEKSLYTSGQPSQAEFKGLAAAGFRRVIDLRPSAEVRRAIANRPASP